MKGTRAAQRYAKAILDLAKDQNVAEVVNSDMESISKTIIGSNDLHDVLTSPVLKSNLKKNVLKEIFKDVNQVTLGAFDVLIENKRINILKEVAQTYISLYNEMNHVQVAKVTTAVPLNAELEAKILTKITELTGGGATINNIVDPNIIGGFILRIEDLQYNASVANSLSNLERELKNSTFISKI
ncbi:ATP synthase F1 subcomplex delta subunit [Gillisia sp. Hel1_33_143]|uniref:ATP synthase F1 subunit delta n=1 Tax=Gillisia sp. Hel1_33_143 TaxID=1336796 RepID=UPI000879205B|nr:ATP synthase F1 subunit delta [Gillisia sp. Hel1_33_143]SDR84349.1 ATP synthase F1 subcomplex delta subunit [Gillisia sp. Hel1_33_143]